MNLRFALVAAALSLFGFSAVAATIVVKDANGTNQTVGALPNTTASGADAVSNTQDGLPTYARCSLFNGTTWDRCYGDATNGAFVNVKTSVLPTGAATAANQSTANTELGSLTETAPGTDTASSGLNGRLQRIAQNLTTVNTSITSNSTAPLPTGTNLIGKVGIDQTTPGTTNGVQVNAALPAGSNVIGAVTQSGTWNIGSITTLPALVAGSAIVGKVGIDQTTPGTTNGVQSASESATGSAVPAKASLTGANSSGNLTGIVQADGSAAINVATATTTQLIALSAGKAIYVTGFDMIAGGTGNVTFEYGTGTNCGTGTTVLTGAYPLTAQAGLARGGSGVVWKIPASNALCVLTSAAVQISGSVSYTQF